MPEDDTTFVHRASSAVSKNKKAAAISGGTGLTAGVVIWMFATFAQDKHFQKHCDQCEQARYACEQARSRIWQKVMDHEVALARRGNTYLAVSNDVALIKP